MSDAMTDLPTRDEALKKLLEACHYIEQAACDAGSGLLDGLDPYDQIIKEDDWKVFLDALCAFAALPAEDEREKRREEVLREFFNHPGEGFDSIPRLIGLCESTPPPNQAGDELFHRYCIAQAYYNRDYAEAEKMERGEK